MLHVLLLVSIVAGSGLWSLGALTQTQNSHSGGAEPPIENRPATTPVERGRPNRRRVAPRLGRGRQISATTSL